MIVTDEVDVLPPCPVSVQFSMNVPLLQLSVHPAGTPPSPVPASDGYVSVLVPARAGQPALLFAPAVTVSV
jgi:hypothetical protein